jgi:hypothetical protein
LPGGAEVTLRDVDDVDVRRGGHEAVRIGAAVQEGPQEAGRVAAYQFARSWFGLPA